MEKDWKKENNCKSVKQNKIQIAINDALKQRNKECRYIQIYNIEIQIYII